MTTPPPPPDTRDTDSDQTGRHGRLALYFATEPKRGTRADGPGGAHNYNPGSGSSGSSDHEDPMRPAAPKRGDNAPPTVLADQLAVPPLHVQRVMYCEESLPAMAYLYMMSSSGGMLGGDRYAIDITLGEESMVHLTTQGATRIYQTGSAPATQETRIKMHKNSYMELMPDQIIPYARSKYVQKTSIEIDRSATLVYTEVLSSGRQASGESFEYDLCSLETAAFDTAKRPLIYDSTRITGDTDITAAGVMHGHKVMGTAYVLLPETYLDGIYEEVARVIAERCNHNLDHNNDDNGSSGGLRTEGGVTITHDDSGIVARVLGRRSEDISAILFAVAAAVRSRVLDAPLAPLRKG